MKRNGNLFLVVAVLIAGLGLATVPPTSAQQKPNILVI
jgi:hypothetical protein